METQAKIVSSFGPRGLIAEHGTSWMLPRLVGPANALDIFWSSRKIEGEEAFRMGWANRLCAPGQAKLDAEAYLRAIAETSAPTSIMMMKRQVYKHLNRELGPAMQNQLAGWMTVWRGPISKRALRRLLNAVHRLLRPSKSMTRIRPALIQVARPSLRLPERGSRRRINRSHYNGTAAMASPEGRFSPVTRRSSIA